MSNGNEKDILNLALAKGFISRNDIALAERQTDQGSSVLSFLIGVNLIDEEIVERLQIELQQLRSTFSMRAQDLDLSDETPTLLPRERRDSGEVQGDGRTRSFDPSIDFSGQLRIVSADSDFPSQWERYQYVRFLGEGGMGRVFLALDPRLKRHVAIKFVRSSDANSVERFLNEAQTQARVTHNNLCKVYEVGEVDGRPYIVMQYIDGLALNLLGPELGLEQKLVLIRDVAEGLQHAHRCGLIHRDIKPSNIIVENAPGQGYRPVVLDFGLARQQAAPGLTVTGAVVGTPHYMPPEQARGEIHILDRRGDVYSLGATMYELLCGEQPFSGESSLSILFKVINDEPVSLRAKKPGIPEDVDTICLKCLEKNPEKRYDSARALADDINRYLEGEPIKARRASLIYQLRKRAAKHKGTVITGAVLLVVLLIVMIWSWRQQARIRSEAQLALQFGQEVQEMEDDLRKVYLIPLHDIREQRAMLETRVDRFRERTAKVGKLGIGPGNYALGSAYLALERFDPALHHLELSWQSGFRRPEVAYALGRVLGELYKLELNRIRYINDKDERAKAKAEIVERFSKPARAYLEQVPPNSMDAPEYIESLLAFYDNEYSRALQRAQAAFARNTWFYEALILEGDVYKVRADESFNVGEYASAQADYQLAGEAYRHASRVGESDPLVYLAQADLAESQMLLSIYGQGELTSAFQQGIAACESALEADRENFRAYLAASSLYLRMAENLRTSADSRSMLDQAIEMAEKAHSYNQEDADILSQLGRSYGLLAELLERLGEDPQESYEQSHQAYVKAIALDPSYRNYNRMGLLLKSRGFSERKRGRDPSAYWQQAGDAFAEARKIDPSKFGTNHNQGELEFSRAFYLLSTGLDPSETLQNGIEAYRSALAINPQAKNSWAGLGDVYNLRAKYLLEDGKSAVGDLNQAQSAFKKALDIDNQYGRAYLGLGETFFYMAVGDFMLGGSGRPNLEKAIEIMKKAIALEPDNYRHYMSLGTFHLEAASQDVQVGVANTSDLELAFKALQKCNELSPNHVELASAIAKVYELRARLKLQKSQDPRIEIDKAQSWVNKGLTLDPSAGRLHFISGQTMLLQARWQWLQRRDYQASLQAARDTLLLSNQLKTNWECRVALGYWTLWSMIFKRHTGQSIPGLDEQVAALKALEVDAPDRPESLALRGLLGLLSDTDERQRKKAEANCRAAVEGNRNLKRIIDEVRATIDQGRDR